MHYWPSALALSQGWSCEHEFCRQCLAPYKQLGEQGTQGIMNGVAITVTICRLQQPSTRKGTFLKADQISEVVVPRAEVVSIELTTSE